MSTEDIVKVVDPIAAKYGVPTFVWEVVAQTESGFDPRARGDHNSSFGLFQLHRGGQLGNLTEEQAFDPKTNAETAMPAIAQAWKDLNKGLGTPDLSGSAKDPGTFNWWYLFAVESGHPGADSNAATAEARQLQQNAQNLTSHPLPGGSNSNQTSRQTYPATAGGPGLIQKWINDWVNANLVAPLQSGAIKVGIFALAVVLLIFGLWAVAKQ